MRSPDNPTYRSYKAMIDRCCKPDHHAFPHYGGRGITVMPRWHEFHNFIRDMGLRPPGHTIDRIDNDKSYEKSNCRWATATEQARNRRNNLYVEYNGVTKPLREWSVETGVSYHTLYTRIYRKGLSADVAFTMKKHAHLEGCA